MSKSIFLPALVMFGLAGGALAQIGYQPADLNHEVERAPFFPSGASRAAVSLNGLRLFAGYDAVSGEEPWRCDGTEAGTGLVTELRPGSAGVSLRSMRTIGGMATFIAGNELYRSDGTAAGTTLVFRHGLDLRDWAPLGDRFLLVDETGLSVTDGTPEGTVYLAATTYWGGLVPLGDQVVFEAPDGAWTTDGTVAGTRALGVVAGVPLVHGGKMYFAGTRAEEGTEFWVSDGTPSGTALLADLLPGSASSSPSGLTAVGDQVFFTANTSEAGRELYVFDGNGAGTYRVLDLEPGPGDGLRTGNSLLGDGTGCYFSPRGRDNELWYSDGTEAGTRLLADLGATSGAPWMLGTYHGAVLAWVPRNDGYALTAVTDTEITELTKVTFDAYAAPDWTWDAFVVDDLFYFYVKDAGNHLSLWRTDGTPGGTALFKRLQPHRSSSREAEEVPPQSGGDYAVFSAYDGARRTFVSDGSSAGTGLLYDGGLYDVAPGRETWFGASGVLARTDGTVAGTMPHPGVQGETRWVFPFRNALHFWTDEVLYRMDPDTGTLAAAWVPDPPRKVSRDARPRETTVGLWVWLEDASDLELWLWNDTGAHRVADLGYDREVVFCDVASDRLVFALSRDPHQGLSVATATGVAALHAVQPSGVPVHFGGRLYFGGTTAETGLELWGTDGTAAGTEQVADINPGPASGLTFFEGAVLDDLFYFGADDGIHGAELFACDGTEAGTTLVGDVLPGAEGLGPKHPTTYAGRVFFSGHRVEDGRELWASDGTAVGTVPVLDVLPGPRSGAPDSFCALTGGLIFWRNADAGREPYVYRDGPRAHVVTAEGYCAGTAHTVHAFEDHPDTVYAWSVTGGTITAGQGTRSLDFQVGAGPELTLSVTVWVGAQSDTWTATLPVRAGVPAAPGPIGGPLEVCPGETGVVYSIDEVPDAVAYHWTLPAGATLVSGAGTPDVVVDFGLGSGTVSVVAENACGTGPEASLAVAVTATVPAYAGDNQTVCGVETMLTANLPADTTGAWTVEAGTGGHVADPGDPQSAFEGLPGETYRLRWTLTHAVCGMSDDVVTLVFASPGVVADAGPDQTVCGGYADLAGNAGTGMYGTWAIVSGTGGRLADSNDPQSRFFGLPGQTYELRWFLRGKPCDETVDSVTIAFLPGNPVYAGEDAWVTARTPWQLTGIGAPGTWTVVDGPDPDPAQFDDPSRPTARFTPALPGTYVLRRTVQAPGCTPRWDEVTVSVTDALPAPSALGYTETTASGGTLAQPGITHDGFTYFTATSQDEGLGLYRSDGSQTTFITRLHDRAIISYWGVVGDAVVFYDVWTDKLWVTHGSGADTFPVFTGNAEAFVSTGDMLYFIHITAIWQSDGTAAGTHRSAYDRGFPSGAHEGRLLLASGGGIYLADSTFAGSTLLHTGGFEHLASLDGLLYFIDGGTLYAHDGGPTGGRVVKVLNADGAARPEGSAPAVVLNGIMYFSVFTPDTGLELWRSDGTEAGTFLLQDLLPGSGSGMLEGPSPRIDTVVAGQTLYFHGTDGVQSGLWATDGSVAGAVFVDARIGPLYALENRVFFKDAGTVWFCDGSAAAVPIQPAVSHAAPDLALLGAGGGKMVVAAAHTGRDADVFSGTDAEDFNPIGWINRPGRSVAPAAAAVHGRLVFARFVAETGVEPWVVDAGGPRLLRDIQTGTKSSVPSQFVAAGDLVYFSASVDIDGVARVLLWRTDGTEEGTVPLSEALTSPTNLTAFGDRLVFSALGPLGTELYLTDGSSEGTRLVADIHPGGSALPQNLAVWRDRVYFSAFNGTARVLYQSDGTEAGTLPCAFFFGSIAGVTRVYPAGRHLFYETNGTLYGVADTSVPAVALGSTDNLLTLQPVGDQLLMLVRSGSWAELRLTWGPAFDMLHLDTVNDDGTPVSVGNGASAVIWNENEDESVVWYSDGTPAGTTQVADAPALSLPMKSGDNLWMLRDTPATGREPVVIAGPTPIQGPELVPGAESPHVLAAYPDGHGHFLVCAGHGNEYTYYYVPDRKPLLLDPVLSGYLTATADGNHDGFFDILEASTPTALELPDAGVHDVTGIHLLPGLTHLNLRGNQLTEIGPLLRTGLLARPGDSVVLADNFLDAGDCPDITVLSARAVFSGAAFDYAEQGGDVFYPPHWVWPDYDILEMAAGVAVPATHIDCGSTARLDAPRTGGAR